MPDQIKTAIISVSDKRNLEVLAKGLYDSEVRIYATEGTAKEIIDYSPIIVPTEFKYSSKRIIWRASDGKQIGLGLEPGEGTNLDLVVWNLLEFGEIIGKPSGEIMGKVVKGQRRRDAIDYMDISGLSVILTSVTQYRKECVTIVYPEDYSKVVEELKTKGFISEQERRNLQHSAEEYVELAFEEFWQFFRDLP